jgi:hypothetical protein
VDEHVHLILADLSILDADLLLLDPGAADIVDRFSRPRETPLNM